MSRTSVRALALAVAAVLVSVTLASCGEDITPVSAAMDSAERAEAPVSPDDGEADSGSGFWSGAPRAASPDRTCMIEGRTVETAIAAFSAAYGRPPSSVSEVAEEFLREDPSDAWELAGAGSLDVVGIGRCDGVVPD